jgi:hypothetical protein
MKKLGFITFLSWRPLLEEIFYFFCSLLILGGIFEILLPGLFVLYFNAAFLAAIGLGVLLLLLYVRR